MIKGAEDLSDRDVELVRAIYRVLDGSHNILFDKGMAEFEYILEVELAACPERDMGYAYFIMKVIAIFADPELKAKAEKAIEEYRAGED